jgi:hypothetical protein
MIFPTLLSAVDTTDVVFSKHAFWLLATGALVPLVGYFLNRLADRPFKWIANRLALGLGGLLVGRTEDLDPAEKVKYAEALKGASQVVIAAVWGAVYTNYITDDAGGIHIFRGIGTAIVSALFSHNLFWKPANVNIIFGAQPTPTQTGTVTPTAGSESEVTA